jgi:hypothetical protein
MHIHTSLLSDRITSTTVDTLASLPVVHRNEGLRLLLPEPNHRFLRQVFCLFQTIISCRSAALRNTTNCTCGDEPDPDPEPPAAPP